MERSVASRKVAKKPKIKRPKYGALKKKLDKVFSIYIRIRDKGKCFTCNVQKPWKQMQNGHYISRAVLSLRFDERNCHAQCTMCNIFKHGAMDVYALKLQALYGDGILAEFQRQKHQVVKLSTLDLETLIQKYELALSNVVC